MQSLEVTCRFKAIEGTRDNTKSVLTKKTKLSQTATEEVQRKKTTRNKCKSKSLIDLTSTFPAILKT
eukprot:2451253-Amphidinium_carterae.1